MISIMIAKEFLKDHLFSEFSKDSILSTFLSMPSMNRQTTSTTCCSTQKTTAESNCSFRNFSANALIHRSIPETSSIICSMSSWQSLSMCMKMTLQLNRIPSRTHQLLQLSAISKVIIKPARRNQSLTFSTSAQTMCPCF